MGDIMSKITSYTSLAMDLAFLVLVNVHNWQQCRDLLSMTYFSWFQECSSGFNLCPDVCSNRLRRHIKVFSWLKELIPLKHNLSLYTHVISVMLLSCPWQTFTIGHNRLMLQVSYYSPFFLIVILKV